MESEFVSAIVQNGPWAIAAVILFKTFYSYVSKKDTEAENNKKEIKCIYEAQITKYNDIVSKLSDEIACDVKEIKNSMQGGHINAKNKR